jgi:ribosomal protein L21E
LYTADAHHDILFEQIITTTTTTGRYTATMTSGKREMEEITALLRRALVVAEAGLCAFDAEAAVPSAFNAERSLFAFDAVAAVPLIAAEAIIPLVASRSSASGTEYGSCPECGENGMVGNFCGACENNMIYDRKDSPSSARPPRSGLGFLVFEVGDSVKIGRDPGYVIHARNPQPLKNEGALGTVVAVLSQSVRVKLSTSGFFNRTTTRGKQYVVHAHTQ